MTNSWLIWGAGGHGAVVLDALLLGGEAKMHDISFVDDQRAGHVYGIRILRPVAVPNMNGCQYIVAVGDNRIRCKIHSELLATPHLLSGVVHPSAAVSRFAKLGPGCYVGAHANIGPGAVIGEGCIINTGANVDHDCVVGPWAHIAPHATLCGNVNVGEFVLIGAGATLLPGCYVGDGATVGGGAVVLGKQRISGNRTVVGVPAMSKR